MGGGGTIRAAAAGSLGIGAATTVSGETSRGGGTFLFRWCEPSTARERALHNLDAAAPEGGRLTNTLLPTVNEEARQ